MNLTEGQNSKYYEKIHHLQHILLTFTLYFVIAQSAGFKQLSLFMVSHNWGIMQLSDKLYFAYNLLIIES